MEKLTRLFVVAAHTGNKDVLPFVRREPTLGGLMTKLDGFMGFVAENTAEYGVRAVPSTDAFWRGNMGMCGLSIGACDMTYTCGFEMWPDAMLGSFGLTSVGGVIVNGAAFPQQNFEQDARRNPDAMLRWVFKTLADEKIGGAISVPIRMAFPNVTPDIKPAFA